MANSYEELVQEIGSRQPSGASSYQDLVSQIGGDRPQQFVAASNLQGKLGFIGGVKEKMEERGQVLEKIYGRQAAGKQAPLRTGLQVVGQAAGAVTDVLGEGLNALGRFILKAVPDKAEKRIGDVLAGKRKGVFAPELSEKEQRQSMGESLGQIAEFVKLPQAVQRYQEFSEENPALAADIESVVNIAALLPIGQVSKVIAKPGLRGVARIVGKGAVATETAVKGQLAAERKEFVRGLVRKVQTGAVQKEQVKRTTETGKGLLQRSIIKPSPRELRMEQFVNEIGGVTQKKSMQQNFNALSKATEKEAKKLVNDLAKNDFIFPRKELNAKLKVVAENLKRSPVIVGDAQKTADKLIAEINRRIKEVPAKGSNLLKVRKEFDSWVKNQKGSLAFDPNRENAFTTSLREIRQGINNFLDTKAPTVGVRNSLKRQSALYEAMDVLIPKAAIEADTAIGRLLQEAGRVLGIKSRAVQAVAAAVGIGGLGAAATFAPGVAVVGISGYFAYRAGKLVVSSKMKTLLANLLRALEKSATKGTIIPADITLIKSLIGKD